MIMRVWHGWTKRKDADEYDRILRDSILPGIHRIDGYKGSWLMRRDDENETEFITITTWESWDAIKRFAPDGHAVIDPRADALLTRWDKDSVHYDGVWVP